MILKKTMNKWVLSGIVIVSVGLAAFILGNPSFSIYSIKAGEDKPAQTADSATSSQKTTAVTTGVWGTCSWTFDSSTGELSIEGGDLGIASQSPWNTRQISNKDIQTINFTGNVILPVDSRKLFSSTNSGTSSTSLGWLTSIKNSSLLDTSQVTNMDEMFDRCASLMSLDVSTWVTSKVTTMNSMFSGCQSPVFTTLDLTSWDTSNVRDMSRMFSYCRNLGSINVTGWNTTSVNSMSEMFMECNKLATLDITSWDTSSVTSMNQMFSVCGNLETLDVTRLNTRRVNNMSNMFFNCSKLTELNVSSWNTSNVISMESVFNGCHNLEVLDVANFDTRNVRTMKYTFRDCRKLTTLDVTNWDTSNVTTMEGLFLGCAKLTSLDVKSWNTSKVTNMDILFRECKELPVLDVTNFDTSKVTSMNQMFSRCESLAELNVSNWNMAKVTSMELTFSGCKKLTTLDVSRWDTSKMTDIGGVFSECSSLTTLDVSSWNTSEMIDIGSVFGGCSSLTTLDVSSWDTSKATGMSSVFSRCSSLTTIDVSNWNTINAVSMSSMFNGCGKLTNVDVSKWDTSKVNDLNGMQYMFKDCVNLTELDVTNFNTSKVTNMQYMFTGCVNLTELDVTNFDTSQVTTMNSMFTGCVNLTDLDVTNFDTSQGIYMDNMFAGCVNLTELDVTNFNTSQVTNMNSMFEGATGLKSLDLSSFNFTKAFYMTKFLKDTTNLSTLTLGASFDTLRGDNSVIQLPPVDLTSGEYTGRWIGASESNKGVVYGSSDDLVDHFRPETLGSFVWEKRLVPNLTAAIAVNETAIVIGDTFQVTNTIKNEQTGNIAYATKVSIPLPDLSIAEVDLSSLEWVHPDGTVEDLPESAVVDQTLQVEVGDLDVHQEVSIRYSLKAKEQVDQPQGLVLNVTYENIAGEVFKTTDQGALVISGGILSFQEVPEQVEFETAPISALKQTIYRKLPDWAMQVSDTRTTLETGSRDDWYVNATIATPLSSGDKELTDALVYKNETGQATPLGRDSVTVFSHGIQGEVGEVITPVSWLTTQGILIEVLPGQALKDTQYGTTINWNLVSGPL